MGERTSSQTSKCHSVTEGNESALLFTRASPPGRLTSFDLPGVFPFCSRLPAMPPTFSSFPVSRTPEQPFCESASLSLSALLWTRFTGIGRGPKRNKAAMDHAAGSINQTAGFSEEKPAPPVLPDACSKRAVRLVPPKG